MSNDDILLNSFRSNNNNLSHHSQATSAPVGRAKRCAGYEILARLPLWDVDATPTRVVSVLQTYGMTKRYVPEIHFTLSFFKTTANSPKNNYLQIRRDNWKCMRNVQFFITLMACCSVVETSIKSLENILAFKFYNRSLNSDFAE